MEGSPSGIGPEALARLVEGRQQFLSFLEKRIQSKAAAEDILQAAFVRTLEKGGAVRDEESVVAWFYRVLRNAIIDYYRQQSSRSTAQQTLLAELQQQPQEPGELFRNQICQCVSSVLDNVKPEYREALQTIDLNDGSLADLASQAGITSNNAAVRVHRAREALRKQVITACGVCATHGCLDCTCGNTR